ncbi:MAG: D-tyrosyl-tRNA(Tyr) deacylase [Clostridia bacterium]|nr:D-tyrosyl-tRNA(Tyr) deacylase [Clostridia bacterium]
MRAVVQRVLQSSVSVNGRPVGAIGQGFNILLGVMDGDTEAEATLLAGKIARLRVFEDAAGKMNLSMTEVGGAALVISQFTLCANLKKGNRPSFVFSAPPEEAERLYRFFCDALRANGVAQVETGEFGADMRVEIVNDGPVTIVMDTEIWKNSGK